MSETQLLVRQVRSSIGSKPKHRGTLRSLGLGRIGKSNTLPDRPEIRGMIARVPHLITVEEVDAATAKAKAPAKKKATAKVADPVAAALATDKAAKAEKTPVKAAAAKTAPAAKKAPAKAAATKKTAAKKAPATKTAAKKADS